MHGYKVTVFFFLLLYIVATITRTANGETEQSSNKWWLLGIADTVKDTVIHQTEAAGTILQQFESFILSYGKDYGSLAEKMLRFSIFKDNLKIIDELMSEKLGDAVYAVNRFADLTQEEFAKRYLTFMPSWAANNKSLEEEGTLRRRGPAPDDYSSEDSDFDANASNDEEPEAFDWRDNNEFYPPCQEQGTCGSCYAFTVAGAIEIMYSKEIKKVTYLSKQQLIDCSDNYGCGGGQFPPTLHHIWRKGLVRESHYLYKGKAKKYCALRYQYMDPAARITGYKTSFTQANIIKNLPSSPIMAGINSSPSEIQFYASGIIEIDPKKCKPEGMNHAVLIVGYGIGPAPAKVPFYAIRNSWGPGYGDGGHFYIKRGICGVEDDSYMAILGSVDSHPRPPRRRFRRRRSKKSRKRT